MPNSVLVGVKKYAENLISRVKNLDRVPVIPYMGLGAFLLFYGFFALVFGSPIIGSDEYTYLISGKYLNHRSQLLALDPYLPNLSNVLYFSLIHFWYKLGFSDPTVIARALHIIEYGVAACLIYSALRNICEQRYLILGLACVLLLPHACYNLVIMPEIEMVLAGAILGFIFMVIFPRHLKLGALLMGIVIGISLLIKPHAIAMLGATILAMLGVGYFGVIPRKNKFAIVWEIVIMLATTYGVALLLWRLGINQWTVSPKELLGLKYYGGSLAQQLDVSNLLRKTINFLMYAGAHVAVLLLIFSPALVGIGMSFQQLFRLRKDHLTPGAVDSKTYLAILFTAAMIISHIFMVAYFTAGLSLIYENEAMRLHGRNLGPMIVYLPFFYFYYIRHNSDKYRHVLIPVFALAVLINQLVIFRFFKIFPWDYPVLFGFFTSPNHYHWSIHGKVTLGHWLMLCTFAGILVLWFYKKSTTVVMSLLLFLILSAGTYQTLNWMRVHSEARQELSRYPRTLAKLIDNDTPGQGVLVWSSRDDMTYILYGLANAPKVLLREPESVISDNDIMGADWVLFNRQYHADFDYQRRTEVGLFSFILLKSGIPIIPHHDGP